MNLSDIIKDMFPEFWHMMFFLIVAALGIIGLLDVWKTYGYGAGILMFGIYLGVMFTAIK